MSYRHHSVIPTRSTRTSWRLGLVAGVLLISLLSYALHLDMASSNTAPANDKAGHQSLLLQAARAAYAQGQIDALETVLMGGGGMRLAQACAALRQSDQVEVLP